MGDPRRTGISAITDRIVYIRHAGPGEREVISEKLEAGGGASPDPVTSDIAVAVENDRLIGFAVLQKGGRDSGTACLTLDEDGRRKGIGGLVLQHLLDHSKVNRVIGGRESARYLVRAGFRRGKGPGTGRTKGVVCAGRSVRSSAAYERARSGSRKGPRQ